MQWFRLYMEDEEGVEIEVTRELAPQDLDDPRMREELLATIKDAIVAHTEEA